jgi:hypothetical protein
MGKFTVSVSINSSQQGVFDFLSNAANFQRWMPHMQSATWTSGGETRVGTTGRGVTKCVLKLCPMLAHASVMWAGYICRFRNLSAGPP